MCKIDTMYISDTYSYDKCHSLKCHLYVSVFFFGWGGGGGAWVRIFFNHILRLGF